MTFGAEFWGPPLISALASAGSSWLTGASKAPSETKMQKTQRNLIDQLIASLGGNGPYSNLFSTDENAFQKSFVDPAKAMFNNQIAPQIQQNYIASGQQRGTGLDDTLTRAGVDLDSMLNQFYYQSQQDALNRQQNAIGSILGAGSGAANSPTGLQNAIGGIGGYIGSSGFANTINDLFKNPSTLSTAPSTAPNAVAPRKGFDNDWMSYQLGDKRWGGS